jgi:hypothetical protein
LEHFQILCVPHGRIHGSTRRCNGVLLKVREGNEKRAWWDKMEAGSSIFLFSGTLKLKLTYEKRRTW